MIDHCSLPVTKLQRSAAFYDAVLAPLGYRRLMEFDEAIGYGDHHPAFWIGVGARPVAGAGLHVAFAAGDRPAVDAFHAAGLAAGARDDGPPGLRPHYHPDYYAAFLVDPDGYKVEAVCHRPADAA
jgi:catechol 2,3-dioxygenase-like lactoylglutathione lyase family enzyme